MPTAFHTYECLCMCDYMLACSLVSFFLTWYLDVQTCMHAFFCVSMHERTCVRAWLYFVCVLVCLVSASAYPNQVVNECTYMCALRTTLSTCMSS